MRSSKIETTILEKGEAFLYDPQKVIVRIKGEGATVEFNGRPTLLPLNDTFHKGDPLVDNFKSMSCIGGWVEIVWHHRIPEMT